MGHPPNQVFAVVTVGIAWTLSVVSMLSSAWRLEGDAREGGAHGILRSCTWTTSSTDRTETTCDSNPAPSALVRGVSAMMTLCMLGNAAALGLAGAPSLVSRMRVSFVVVAAVGAAFSAGLFGFAAVALWVAELQADEFRSVTFGWGMYVGVAASVVSFAGSIFCSTLWGYAYQEVQYRTMDPDCIKCRA